MEQESAPYIPGDVVGFELEQITHEMRLREVQATFTEEVPIATMRSANTIVLAGTPEEKPEHRRFRGPELPILRFSRVVLLAQIPRRAAAGEYRCTGLIGVTYSGHKIPFDQADREHWKNWSFRVREEPNTPPRIAVQRGDA